MKEDHIIVGSITVPYSLSNPERLFWLEDWIVQSTFGLNCNRTIELIFLNAEDIADSMGHLLRETDWKLIDENNLFSPDGTIVRFHYDEEAEKLLNEHR